MCSLKCFISFQIKALSILPKHENLKEVCMRKLFKKFHINFSLSNRMIALHTITIRKIDVNPRQLYRKT